MYTNHRTTACRPCSLLCTTLLHCYIASYTSTCTHRHVCNMCLCCIYSTVRDPLTIQLMKYIQHCWWGWMLSVITARSAMVETPINLIWGLITLGQIKELSCTVHRPLKWQRAQRKGTAAWNQMQGLCPTGPVLCQWATTPTSNLLSCPYIACTSLLLIVRSRSCDAWPD